MANFCYSCTQKVFPDAKPEDNDMAHGKKGEYVRDICEECGVGWFDWQGKRSTGTNIAHQRLAKVSRFLFSYDWYTICENLLTNNLSIGYNDYIIKVKECVL